MINIDKVIEELRAYSKEREMLMWVHEPNGYRDEDDDMSYFFNFKNPRNNYTWVYELTQISIAKFDKVDKDMNTEVIEVIKLFMPELLFKTPRCLRKKMRDLSTPATSMTVEITEDDDG